MTGFATVDSPCETRNEIKIILSISSKTLSSHPVPVRRSAPVPPAAAVLSAAPTVVDVARLAGVENPKHEDTEQTLAELKARIAKTIR